MPQIRPPSDFNGVANTNNFRPVSIDEDAATSFTREAKKGFDALQQIVTQATDNTMRSQALADSVDLEVRLTRARNELESEPPPEGTDVTDWARTMPERWERRAKTEREAVMRARGRRPNTYLRYFEERATPIMGRETQVTLARSQAAVIDIDRGAGMELLGTLLARATDPDLPETAEAGTPSRAYYEQQYIETAREFARRGTWSHAYAAEQITSMQRERQQFADTEGRYQQSRNTADEIRAAHPDDFEAQLAAAAEIEDARGREQTTDFILADMNRDQATATGENQAARSRVETLINQHGAAWQRYATPADIERINRDPGARAQIRAQLDDMLDPTGSSATTRGLNSARYRALLEDVGNSTDPLVGRVFAGIDLDKPITAQEAAALRNAGFMEANEGDVLSATLTREDYQAVTDMQRTRRTGQMPNGGLVVDREVNDVVAYVRANGLADFGGDEEAGTRRVMQNQFRAFVSQIVRDEFSNGGARDLTPAEISQIAQLALSRAQPSGRGRNNTPLYRRRNSNRLSYDQIPAATAARLRRQILATGEGSGRTTTQIDELVADAYAEENRNRARE